MITTRSKSIFELALSAEVSVISVFRDRGILVFYLPFVQQVLE
jgi:hypothetical protein